MKPPARNKKAPGTFEFDANHVLGSARVSKHRNKIKEKIKKRVARKIDDPTPGEDAPADETVGTAAEAAGGAAEAEAAMDSTKKTNENDSNKK